MPSNPENNYEDSYQKEERLRQELKLTLGVARHFIETAKKDFKKVGDLLEKMRGIEKEIEELNKLEGDLKVELNNLESKEEALTDIDEKIDAAKDTSEQQSKIWELWVKQDDLYKELFKMYKDEAGMKGDFEGTIAIIDMKIKRIEEIKKELRKIEN